MAETKEQFELDVTLKDNDSTLVLTVRDHHHHRKFTNTYTDATLASKGLTQSIDKFKKLLKTAAKNSKENWSMVYGYEANKSTSNTDQSPSYLPKSRVSALRSQPIPKDSLYIILRINEDFFSVDTQFKLYEIEKEKAKKTKSRRTLSGAVKVGHSSSAFSTDFDEQKIKEMEAKIKSLTRDNQALRAKLEKADAVSSKKQKKMDTEREMRLQANKERFWLKQKLERLQKAIAARLKILGVDFSKVDDITSALDMAFNVIQKLAKELQEKEDAFEEMKEKHDAAIQEAADARKMKDKLDATIEKQRGVLQDLRKQIGDRDRRLSIAAHEQNDKESVLRKQLEEMQAEADGLRQEKEKVYDQMVDEKAKLKGELDDKLKELEDVKKQLLKAKEENGRLESENEQIKDENEKLLNSNNDLNAKLQEALKEIEELKSELQAEKDKNVNLIDQNKKLKKEMKKLIKDLARLKALLEKATNIELQLKNTLDDASDLVSSMTKEDKSDLVAGDDEDEDD
mmetsp:Transcript_54623/g.87313  ORF Transcript_54623/g.87313 Transcript_54623/m.87313 type:complete len:513 (-) Transcript_54623:257-1795(-)